VWRPGGGPAHPAMVTIRAKALVKALLCKLVADCRINWIYAVDTHPPRTTRRDSPAIPARPEHHVALRKAHHQRCATA